MLTRIKVYASYYLKLKRKTPIKSNEGEGDVRCDAVQDMPLILTVNA